MITGRQRSGMWIQNGDDGGHCRRGAQSWQEGHQSQGSSRSWLQQLCGHPDGQRLWPVSRPRHQWGHRFSYFRDTISKMRCSAASAPSRLTVPLRRQSVRKSSTASTRLPPVRFLSPRLSQASRVQHRRRACHGPARGKADRVWCLRGQVRRCPEGRSRQEDLRQHHSGGNRQNQRWKKKQGQGLGWKMQCFDVIACG